MRRRGRCCGRGSAACPGWAPDSRALFKKEVRWMEIANKRRLDGSGILDGYEVGIFVILSLGLVS